MIIRYPTGLYRPALPGGDSVPGNITYVVSSNDPPRSTETFQELPISEAVRQKDPISPDDADRRDTFGELAFTIAEAAQTVAGSAKKSFEVGQILTFDTEDVDAKFDQNMTSVEVMHDTNLLDLESLGLSGSEIDELIKLSEEKEKEIESNITTSMSVAEDLRVEIVENQKTINETRKTVDAAVAVGAEKSIVDKLNASLVMLEAERTALIEELDKVNANTRSLRDQLLVVSQLVR